MTSGLGDQISIPSSVERYFSEIFDKDSRALEGFLRDFKTVGYKLKEELCNIHRRTVLFGHSDYTLYDGNPKPDQQSPYQDCKFNPDHLLVKNSSFKAWRDESTIKQIFAHGCKSRADVFEPVVISSEIIFLESIVQE
jgi:hypothetical protein